jgi:hypothetical protein
VLAGVIAVLSAFLFSVASDAQQRAASTVPDREAAGGRLMTKSLISLLGDGILAVLTNWETYASVLVATLGALLQQSAFSRAPSVPPCPPDRARTGGRGPRGDGPARADPRRRGRVGAHRRGVLAMLVGTVALARSSARLEPGPAPG